MADDTYAIAPADKSLTCCTEQKSGGSRLHRHRRSLGPVDQMKSADGITFPNAITQSGQRLENARIVGVYIVMKTVDEHRF